jgi:polar amino acid transport system permease protein
MSYDFQWGIIAEYRELLVDGLLVTLRLSAWTICLSIPLAIAVALGRLSSWRLLRAFTGLYGELFRNTPLLVQIFYFYFVLGLDSFPASVAALVLNASAYMGEVIRAGIQSIPRTQYEAAYSISLRKWQVNAYVILPQAGMIVIPPIGTELLNIVRNSSLAMSVGVAELSFQAQQLESITFRGFEAATVVTAMYLALSLLIVSILGVIERVTNLHSKLA